MKDFFIRFVSGVLILCIFLYILPIFNINWLQEGNPNRNLVIVSLALAGGWGSLYLYKAIKKEKK